MTFRAWTQPACSLLWLTDSDLCLQDHLKAQMKTFNVGADCPVFKGMYQYIQASLLSGLALSRTDVRT